MRSRWLLFVGAAGVALLILLWRFPSASVADAALVGDGLVAPDAPEPAAAVAPLGGASLELTEAAVHGSRRAPQHEEAPALLGRIRVRFLGVPYERVKAERFNQDVHLAGQPSRDALRLGGFLTRGSAPMLLKSGVMEFAELRPGDYVIYCRSEAPLRFEWTRVQLGEGETVELEIPAVVPSLYALRVHVTGGIPTGTAKKRWSVRALQPFGRSLGATATRPRVVASKTVSAQEVVDLELELYPGTVRLEFAVLGSRGRPVIPPMSTAAEVLLPPVSEEMLLDRGRIVNDDPLPVALEFIDHTEATTFRGTVGKGDQGRSGGFELVGTSVDGVEFSEMLIVRSDGGFTFSCELARLEGPQVSLRSRKHDDVIGPFPLSTLNTDLGTLIFSERNANQLREVAEHAELKKIFRAPPEPSER